MNLRRPPSASNQGGRNIRLGLRAFLTGLNKAVQILLVGVVIGVLDDLQVRYLDVAQYGTTPELLYQAMFMGAASIGAYALLRQGDWGRWRNVLNLMVAVPLATIADNVSIDAGTGRLYFLIIPQQGYEWRQAVFARLPALSQTAVWVNKQSLASGLINGYVLAIALTATYIAVQYTLYRRKLSPISPHR